MNSFTIQHSNRKGTGTALKMELLPATDKETGSLILTFARQKKSDGDVIPARPFFDWNDARSIWLETLEVAKVLEVFAGETESIDDGKGLLDSAHKQALILRHVVEPVQGYELALKKIDGEGNVELRVIMLTQTEGRMLYDILQGSMSILAFGR